MPRILSVYLGADMDKVTRKGNSIMNQFGKKLSEGPSFEKSNVNYLKAQVLRSRM